MSIATFAANPTAVTLQDPYVLHGRQLRDGVRLEDTSRYSDPIWRLTPARLKAHEGAHQLNFPVLPQRFRASVKRLFYALLSLEPPDGEDSPGIATITEFKRFFLWLDKRWHPELNELSALTPADFEAYLKYLLARFPNNSAKRGQARGPLRMLWRWRRHLHEDALRFDPLHLDGWSEAGATSRGENKNARIPEEVLGPLVVWALRFIDDFAPDICEGDRRWREIRTAMDKKPRRNTSHSGVGARLQAVLDEYVAAGRPLPGYQGQPSTTHFARLLGCDRASVLLHREMVAATAKIVGVADAAFVDTVQGRLDGEPWVPAITTDHVTPNSLAALARHLQVACYIVIAFFSGMRDSEVKHIKRGCVTVKLDEDGQPYRWKLRSLAFKGEDDTVGVPATWTVSAAVARAIETLERLQPPDQDYLFARLPHGAGARKGLNLALTVTATNKQLNAFVSYINELCVSRGRTDAIKDSSGGVFRLKSSNFRRTLAWFIARRPGGVIAGALQYRHHSIQMFEGYADPRELHQPGEKSQVASPRREPDGLRHYYDLTS